MAEVFESSFDPRPTTPSPRLGSLSLSNLVQKKSSNFVKFFYWWIVKHYIKVQKKKKKVVVLFSRPQQNRSHAVTAKKCIKKVQCTCKVLPIAFLKFLSFFPHFWYGGSIDMNNGRFSHYRRIIHVQNLSKLTEKQMDKVRRIVHLKLRPFHFQIKTYYLSDNPSQTDNPSLVWIPLIGAVTLDLFLKAPFWIGLAVGFDHFHVCGYTSITCPRRKKTLRCKRLCKHWRLT